MKAGDNQTMKWLRIATEVGILLFAVGIAWATLSNSVNVNQAELVKLDTRVKVCEQAIFGIRADLREIVVEQKYIRQGIDEIKEGMKHEN